MRPAAFVADIHGNIWALEAVLADIERRGIATVFNLGDSLYGPLEPSRTADRLIESAIPGLRGNQDRILLEAPPSTPHPTLRYTRSCLKPNHFDWLREQPCTIEYGDCFLCHGTPSSDETYLIEAVGPAGVALCRPAEMARLVGAVNQRIVVCGHTHIPRVVALPGDRLIVNPGSVGLPAYADDLPFPHRMESGSTHARYATVEGTRVELIAVPYDWRQAAARARENGRDDWAVALETGYAA